MAILCVSMFLIFRNDEKKQVDLKVNANQNENSNRNLHNEDETEVNNQEVEINDIDSEEKNFLKDKIADDKSEAEANAIVEPKPIISSNESIKTEVSVDIDDFGGDGNVQDEEVEFRDDFVDWEDMTDSDSDGLPDDYEKDIGTDSNNADTDGDGLTDGFEELWSATNPLKCDSFDDEISDSELDSDGDGISDYDEVKWDGIDERYQELSPLHKDTVETLFPEIESTGYNDRAYATYISVDDNDVVLHVKAYFTGDAETEVSQYLKTTGLSQECQDEVDNIKSRLGEDFTFKELIIDGV